MGITDRKSVITGALFIVCFLVAPYASAIKLWKSKTLEVVVSDPFINMRTGPGRGYPIFHVVEKGDTLTVLKRRTDWYKAKSREGFVGWVSRDALNGYITTDGRMLDFAQPGWDEYVNRRRELGILLSDFEGLEAISIYAGYHLTQNISTEARFTKAFGDFTSNELIALNILHQPFVNWRVSPFITLGTGVLRIRQDQVLVQPGSETFVTTRNEENVLTAGGGVFIYLSRRFLLRLEYNNHTILTNQTENDEVEEWKAGFSAFF